METEKKRNEWNDSGNGENGMDRNDVTEVEIIELENDYVLRLYYLEYSFGALTEI